MEIMKHDFGGYIPHIAFIYLLIPLAARKCELLLTSVQQLSVVPSLFITFFISHTCLPLPSPSPAQQRPAEHSQHPYPLQQAEQGASSCYKWFRSTCSWDTWADGSKTHYTQNTDWSSCP